MDGADWYQAQNLLEQQEIQELQCYEKIAIEILSIEEFKGGEQWH